MNGSVATRQAQKSKFFLEDIVRHEVSDGGYGVVLRTYDGEADLPPPHEDEIHDPMNRPLQRGEIGITFFGPPERRILPEAELVVVDRNFQPGDLCKRNIDDVQSGVITSVSVKVMLRHAITDEVIPGWKTANDLSSGVELGVGDYVVYDNWLGQVIEMFDESTIEVSQNKLIRLPEISAHLLVGDRGEDLLPQDFLVTMLNMILPRGGHQDVVVDVKHTVLAICWIAINQSLAPEESAATSKPQRYWHGDELAKLTLFRGRVDQMLRIGDHVKLKDDIDVPVTRHGAGDPNGPIEVRTCVVRDIRTTVNILWQDGTTEDNVAAVDVVPYGNPGDSECWPGDYVIWKNEEGNRPAVVQVVNSVERTAIIKFLDSQSTELASLLELDAWGYDDAEGPMNVHDGFGVRRGEFVFIHREGTTNGCLDLSRTPKIGELESWTREPPELNERGQHTGWRAEMVTLGMNIASQRKSGPGDDAPVARVSESCAGLDWIGEVSDLRLDGSVEVMLPNGATIVVPMNRLTRLQDAADAMEDIYEAQSIHTSDEEYEDDNMEVEILDENGQWITPESEEEGDWEDEVDEVDIQVEEKEATPQPPEAATAEFMAPASVNAADSRTPAIEGSVSSFSNGTSASGDVSEHWKRFDVLPTAPLDHAFYSTPTAQPSRNFFPRLAKEYKVLQNSLPESIIVRGYEDRTDLLRSLIIGPENTPYEDAPFVIDWHLGPDFPQSPPKAHFLSWTNGNGRVNPNLYEEGKVCLSILGTWSGDKTETWSAGRSSLLQALVSIQGLVLVKEPWYCEPSYEKLRGTEEGTVNSRLYSEKAYVLSRGFVRRALEIPLGDINEEITLLYRKNGRLEKVIRDAQALIERSRATSESGEASTGQEEERAIPRLTAGGVIALERTLAKLTALAYS